MEHNEMKHVMIDIETLGLKSNSIILSIGAVFFDIETGELGREFYKNIDPEQHGRGVDVSTIMWWMEQSDRARNDLVSGRKYDLQKVLDDFGLFFCDEDRVYPEEIQVWANGATFDPVLLGDAYKHNPPWRFYNVLDQRTMKFLDRGRTERIEPKTAHNALCDAIAQAKYVSKVWQVLNRGVK